MWLEVCHVAVQITVVHVYVSLLVFTCHFVAGKRNHHLGPTGIYLDDLTTLEPDVAALYFPKRWKESSYKIPFSNELDQITLYANNHALLSMKRCFLLENNGMSVTPHSEAEGASQHGAEQGSCSGSQSPQSVGTGAMDSGTEYLSDSTSYNMDISMSLCGQEGDTSQITKGKRELNT